jgi:hypothetical protein
MFQFTLVSIAGTEPRIRQTRYYLLETKRPDVVVSGDCNSVHTVEELRGWRDAYFYDDLNHVAPPVVAHPTPVANPVNHKRRAVGH